MFKHLLLSVLICPAVFGAVGSSPDSLPTTSNFRMGKRTTGDSYVNSGAAWTNAGCLTLFGEVPSTDELTFSFYSYGADILFRHPSRQLEIHTIRAGGPAAVATFVGSDSLNQFQVREMLDNNSVVITWLPTGDPYIGIEAGNTNLMITAGPTGGYVYSDRTFRSPQLWASNSIVLNGITRTNWAMVPLIRNSTGNNHTLVATNSGSIYGNLGSAGQVISILPTPVAGQEFTFTCEAAVGHFVYLAGGATCRIANLISTVNGDLKCSTQGSSITIKAMNATNWIATSLVGLGWSVD